MAPVGAGSYISPVNLCSTLRIRSPKRSEFSMEGGDAGSRYAGGRPLTVEGAFRFPLRSPSVPAVILAPGVVWIDMETCKRYRDALYAAAPIPGLEEHLIECEGCRELAGRLE